VVSIVCRYGSQVAYRLRERGYREPLVAGLASSTTSSGRPGLPFRAQIKPVIEATARNPLRPAMAIHGQLQQVIQGSSLWRRDDASCLGLCRPAGWRAAVIWPWGALSAAT
jgi:hypothetical protein